MAYSNYKEKYESNKKYLNDCKWFVEKRNSTTKEQPFELVKQIEITVYRPFGKASSTTRTYTVENDIDMSSLLDELKKWLSYFNKYEVFFTSKFSFFEKNNGEDLYDKLFDGIVAMNNFMCAMQNDIGEKSLLCERLDEKITKKISRVIPRDLLMTIDYVYLPHESKFEKASRMSAFMNINKKEKISLLNIRNRAFPCFCENDFQRFVFMNIDMGTTGLMPTIWIIYEDDTVLIDMFNADIKTTFYRKINDTAYEILDSNVKEIYFMMTYALYNIDEVNICASSKERLRGSKEDYLTFVKIDKALNEEEYAFMGSKISDSNYCKEQLLNGKKCKLDFGRINFIPIIEAFNNRYNCSK